MRFLMKYQFIYQVGFFFFLLVCLFTTRNVNIWQHIHTELTLLESRLIARADPVVRIYHLGGPTGQRSYSGNVISMPKQLGPLVNTLPRLPEDCDIFMINQEMNDDKFKDFVVRRWALEKWIDWLIQKNEAYRDVKKDSEMLDLFSNSFRGSIPDGLKIIDDPNLINNLNDLIEKENKKSKNNVYSHVDKNENRDDEKEDDGFFSFSYIYK